MGCSKPRVQRMPLAGQGRTRQIIPLTGQDPTELGTHMHTIDRAGPHRAWHTYACTTHLPCAQMALMPCAPLYAPPQCVPVAPIPCTPLCAPLAPPAARAGAPVGTDGKSIPEGGSCTGLGHTGHRAVSTAGDARCADEGRDTSDRAGIAAIWGIWRVWWCI